ncbi:Mg2+ transporter protein, CorA-like/Zinc transport protein ZntB [Penicillium italicum]|uniref:Mg2+ transporter protein, CorA-like/Zinc transport protein ZntB n=1 Tax=Penicillium italicum TaxID=40296 RepID=A0A0A2KAK4_PENIT|nr:Mg2+ transporter protein, CorA-like/Zinc transport protein ZntB [Penicillium italicum]
MPDAQEDLSTGSKESTGNDSIYWGERIRDQIIDGDGKGLESTLKEHPDALESRFSYRFNDDSPEAEGVTPLILSAGLGRHDMVCMLLESGADEEATTTSGGSPAFFVAIDFGHLEIFKLFLLRKKEVVLGTRNNAKQNTFMRAALFGRLSIIELLLENSADTTATNEDGDSAFTLACIFGKLCVVKKLVAFRPDVVKEHNHEGRNGLLCAIIHKNLSVVEFLIGYPATTKSTDVNGDSAFTLACLVGYLSVIKKLIAITTEVLEERDGDGRTGVLCAAWNDQLEIVQYLIDEKGAKPDDQDETGFTVLHVASYRGNVKMIKYILQKSSDVLEISSFYGQTPLLTAAEEGQVAAVQALLQNQANLGHQNNDEDTALHIASRDGNTELARVLIKMRKDVPLEIRNGSSQTPFLTAVVNKHYDVVDLLIGAGAKIDAKDENGRTALNIAIEYGDLRLVKTLVEKQKDLSGIQNDSKEKALLHAAEKGDSKIFRFLLKAGADIEACGDCGETVLHFAARSGNCELIKMILKQKETLLDKVDHFKKTPLLFAAEKGQHDALDLLLKRGANSKTEDDDKWTVFHYAAKSGDLGVVQEFYKQDASFFNKRNIMGQIALVVAANEGQSNVVDFLVEVAARASHRESYGEDEKFAVLTYAVSKGRLKHIEGILSQSRELVKRRDESGDVPLFIAIKNIQQDVVSHLLTVNDDFSIKDGQGSTLLHCATKSGLQEIMKRLLERNSDLIDEKDTNGETALVIAIRNNDDNLISLLLENKASVDIRDRFGDTVLHSACRWSSLGTVQKLLKRGAEPTTTGADNETALHHAARSGNLQKVDLVLEWLSGNSKGEWTAAEDRWGDTPLNDAISWEEFEIAFKLLKSPFYFPKRPSEVEVHIASQQERIKLAGWLVDQVEKSTSEDIQEHVGAIAYWAILNSHQKLLSALLKKGKLPSLNSQDGSTWAHIAALGNNPDSMKSILDWPTCILDRTKKGIMPLYLAAKRDNSSMLKTLLDGLDSETALEAMIHETEEKDTVLSITAAEERPGKEGSSRELLWLKLCSNDMLPAMKKTLASFNAKTDGLMEQAARSYIRGTRERKPLMHLLSILQDIHGEPHWDGSLEIKKSSTTGEWTILQLVVYYQFPQALWCLLSSGRYYNELDRNLSECNKVNGKWSKHNQKITDIISDLLVTPPPIIQPLATRSLPKSLDEFRKRDRLGILSKQEGIILDLFTTDDHDIAVQLKQASLQHIIYEEGPDEIMSKEGLKDLRSLRDRIYTLEKPTEKIEGGQKPKEKRKPDTKPHSGLADGDGALKSVAPNAETEKKSPPKKDKTLSPLPAGDSKGRPNLRPRKKYRWIHIPVNSLDAVGELMNRISYYTDQPHIHQSLIAFVKQSWSELPVGGGSHCMRPNCVNEPHSKAQPLENDIVKPEKGLNDKAEDLGRLALYVPYLSWSTKEFLTTELQPKKEDIHDQGEAPDAAEEHSEFYQRSISHSPVSLDQYYYAGLQADELQKRNGHQVMSRYLQRQATSKHSPEDSNMNKSTTPGTSTRTFERSGGHEKAKSTHANDEAEKQKASHGEGKGKEGPDVPRAETSYDMSLNDRTVADASSTASQILVINQLWLWIVDESEDAYISAKQTTVCAVLLTFFPETIITTSTKNDTKVRETFLHQVLLRVQAQKKVSELLLSQIVEIIVETATTSFYDVKVSLDATGKAKRSPMDIFRESLQRVRNEEASLFDGFEKSLKGDKAGQQSGSGAVINHKTPPTDQHPPKKPIVTRLGEWWKSLQAHALENRYQNIQNETRLLREIKDILDELRILKELANDQEHVNGLWKKIVDVQIGRRYTIKETKDDLENMIQEAKSVEEAINTLLDLKQKQATILEAQATRQQSDTVMVFTVVTIVFLPASFLTSLFALNVSDFPHQGDSVAFEGRWIFPIIFGVSLGVSTFFVWLAFNAHLFKHALGQTWRQLKDCSSRNVNSERQGQQDIKTRASRLKSLLSAAWRQHENKVDESAERNSHEPHESAPGQLQEQDVGLREEGQTPQMGPGNYNTV